MYESRLVKGEEFIRKIRRLGIERRVPVRFDSIRGKGSHGRLYYGDRYTTVKDRKEAYWLPCSSNSVYAMKTSQGEVTRCGMHIR